MNVETAAFLPVPRLPLSDNTTKLPDPTWLDGLIPGAGDPVRRVIALRAEVHAATAAVVDGRPGGAGWRAAMTADGEAVLAGKTPKVWAVEALLAGDLARWSRASAEARTATRRRDLLLAAARAVPNLVEAARARLDVEELALTAEAEAAYTAAATGATADKPEAWRAMAAARAHREEAGRCRALLGWLKGEPTYDPLAWAQLMPSPETAGHFLAAESLLEGGGRLSMPGTRGRVDPQTGRPVESVRWPRGFDPFSATVGARALAPLLTQGYAEHPDGDTAATA
jgi:hypothetical protein